MQVKLVLRYIHFHLVIQDLRFRQKEKKRNTGKGLLARKIGIWHRGNFTEKMCHHHSACKEKEHTHVNGLRPDCCTSEDRWNMIVAWFIILLRLVG